MRPRTLALALLYAPAALAQATLTPPPPPPEVPPEAVTPAPAPAPEPGPPPTSYAWQLIAADAAGLATGAVLSFATRDLPVKRPSVAAWLGMGLYGVGTVASPAIHFAHGRNAQGMGSLGARVFLPPLASLFGAFSACLATGRFRRDCTESGMSLGFLAGAIGVSVLDVQVFAKIEERERLAKPEPRVWYGWQTLLVDGGGMALAGYLLARSGRDGLSAQDATLSVALGLYLVGWVGSPIVHFVHGHLGAGLGALAMRLFVPPLWMAIGLLGNCAATSGLTGCADQTVGPGFMLGSLAVVAFDALGLAWEPLEVETPGEEAGTKVTFLPSVQFAGDRASFGVAAIF